MNDPYGLTLPALLYAQNPDTGVIIDTFVTRFNATYGNPRAEQWDITKDEWQRYEFLGDRVLNLVVAQFLFTSRGGSLNEGEMTKILSAIVSNRALDTFLSRVSPKIVFRLIPLVIGQQNTYGERITGGAFEAFIGALYCEVGFDDVAFFISTILNDAPNQYDPGENAIGLLQETYQKHGKDIPRYEETGRQGPDHRPVFSVRVVTCDGIVCEGSGPNLADARQSAAKRALDRISLRH
jgi:ribonuclease-3